MSDIFRTHCPCGKPATVGTYAGTLCDDCASKLPPSCDFCNFAAPEWRYPCSSFLEGIYPPHKGIVLISTSTGDWGACLTCHVLIHHGEWDALVERVLSSGPGHDDPRARALLSVKLHSLYADFRKHRKGAPYRVDAQGNRIEGG